MLLLSIITLKTKLLLRFGWYRIWSDKWIEQGGTATCSTSYSARDTVTLLKSYKDTNYNIMVGNIFGETNTSTFARFTGVRTTNQFGVCSGYGNTVFYPYRVFWQTCGYLTE